MDNEQAEDTQAQDTQIESDDVSVNEEEEKDDGSDEEEANEEDGNEEEVNEEDCNEEEANEEDGNEEEAIEEDGNEEEANEEDGNEEEVNEEDGNEEEANEADGNEEEANEEAGETEEMQPKALTDNVDETMVGSAEVHAALSSLRADSASPDRRAWVLLAHADNNPCKVVLSSSDCSDCATMEDLLGKLNDEQVLYAIVRFAVPVDLSNTVKFVYIRWMGEGMAFAKRGRHGVVHGSVEQHFRPYHLMIETSSKDELSEEVILQKLQETIFTRTKILNSSELEGRTQRSYVQQTVLSSSRRAVGEFRAAAPRMGDVSLSDELQQAIDRIRDARTDTDWILAAFQEGNLGTLTLCEEGAGGVDEMRDKLEDDRVMFVFVRIADQVDDINTTKYVYFSWIGENIKPLKRGKVAALAGPVEKIFSPSHLSLTFNNREDLSQEVIVDKVMASSGSKSFVK